MTHCTMLTPLNTIFYGGYEPHSLTFEQVLLTLKKENDTLLNVFQNTSLLEQALLSIQNSSDWVVMLHHNATKCDYLWQDEPNRIFSKPDLVISGSAYGFYRVPKQRGMVIASAFGETMEYLYFDDKEIFVHDYGDCQEHGLTVVLYN